MRRCLSAAIHVKTSASSEVMMFPRIYAAITRRVHSAISSARPRARAGTNALLNCIANGGLWSSWAVIHGGHQLRTGGGRRLRVANVRPPGRAEESVRAQGIVLISFARRWRGTSEYRTSGG